MARIRTVKPEFFRHEGLQDLEAANVGKYPMMVFEALWGHCDKAGRFEWKPRQLKLDILPFLPFEMAETLELLAQAGFIQKYRVAGKEYGYIPSFTEHQRISGKELQEPEKHPEPILNELNPECEAIEKQLGSTRDQLVEQEGKGREKEGKGDGVERATAKRLPADWVPSPEDIAYCRTERPDLDPSRVAESFRDYWHAEGGAKARKVDWSLTWKTWVRNQRGTAQARGSPSFHDERAATLAGLTGGNRNATTSNERDITAEAKRIA